MILRPVRPVSPLGPPITNRPVGLTWILVRGVSSLAGTTGLITCSRIASSIILSLAFSSCWVDTTIASTPVTSPSS